MSRPQLSSSPIVSWRVVGERLVQIDASLAELREKRQRQSEAQRATAERLDGLRRERVDAERALEELRERAQRAELEAQELKLRLEAATETLRRDLDCEPEVAMAAECPPLPEGTSASVRLRELERELRLMGPINPLALEEFTALQERHTFLEAQLEDVKSSRRELARVIKAVDAEIVNVFVGAFADVSQNFSALFETLFPGGQGSLKLTDPDNPLETGIEVEARPSGKNVRKLSLLSGGERSLTAMAFLFAVFRSRPSPFYLLDEVEAALDDVNLHRFLDLLDEFRREAQLIVVSHQKRTMEAADMLYGVTMQPGGSSRVVSEKVAAGASTFASGRGRRRRPFTAQDLGVPWTPHGDRPHPHRDPRGRGRHRGLRRRPSRAGQGHAARTTACATEASGPKSPSTAVEPEVVPDLVAEIEEALAPVVAEKPRFRDRLGKTRSALAGYLGSVRSRDKIDASTWDELEEALILADVGVKTTATLLDDLRKEVEAKAISDPEALLQQLKVDVKARLSSLDRTLRFEPGIPNVWLFVGVNGVGKTTTIGKLAKRQIAEHGRTVVMAAGDTFRAAAGRAARDVGRAPVPTSCAAPRAAIRRR